MMKFLATYWSDLLVSIVGLSAILVYVCQKGDRKKAAATLILGQIDAIEKSVSELKGDHQLGNIAVFHSRTILRENMWEQYKHLFVKKLSSAEYAMIQEFFDCAEQCERAREQIITTITTAWTDKSRVEHQVIADMIIHISDPTQSLNDMAAFQSQFRPMDLVFTPDIAIKSLTKSLTDFRMISGTTAYQKIQKISYNK